MKLDKQTLIEIETAVSLLQSGELVAFPTDTVYGLGADACNEDAVAKIFTIKSRPKDKPLIVLLADTQLLKTWVREVTPLAQLLINQFWPGPLTLIFQKAPGVSDILTAGKQTLGVRIPNHPVALKLITMFANGIATTSANYSGQTSLVTFQQVLAALSDTVNLTLAGDCSLGIESTIVDVSGPEPFIRRVGAISPAEISKVLGQPVKVSI